ncbi:MAG: acetoin dehydrogenase dihydrolipoyllysine-residue acetyltransferase subunit [Mesorhizobium sp.]
MPVEVILPKVDMDMATGRISRWYVGEGAAVKKGDVLFEIETDKAAMEIDAPASGTLRDIVGKEGVDIPVGEAVAWIYEAGEAPAPGKDKPAAAKPADEPVAAQPVVASETKPKEAGRSAPTPVVTSDNSSEKEPASSSAIRATPLARRIAGDAGLALDTVSGSGPNGRIMRADVDRAISAKSKPASQAAAPAARTTTSAPLNHAWLRQGSGRPLVLIHGFGSDMNSWRPMLGAGAVDLPVLGIDLPGHGGSPRNVPADIGELAANVEGTIEALGVGPVTLVGHSFGGGVAATVASRGRVDVRALALIAPVGLGPEINGAFLSGLTRARSEASLLPWLKLLVADQKFLTPAFIRATLAQSQDAGLREVQADIAERFFPDGTQSIDTRDMVAGLHMPVRVIAGASDRIVPTHQAFGLPGQVGLHVFQNTGHMPQIEQAEQVLKIVLEMARATA